MEKIQIYFTCCQAANIAGSFVTPWTVAPEATLSMGFSRQEYWSGLPFPSPGDIPNPGAEPGSPELQADSLPSHQGSPIHLLETMWFLEPLDEKHSSGVVCRSLYSGLTETLITYFPSNWWSVVGFHCFKGDFIFFLFLVYFWRSSFSLLTT